MTKTNEPKKKKSSSRDMIYILLCVFLCFAVIDWSAVLNNPAPSTPSVDRRAEKAKWIVRGKEAVKNRLKDPDSANFRNVFYKNAGGHVICGEVNSKGGFGGYAGFLA